MCIHIGLFCFSDTLVDLRYGSFFKKKIYNASAVHIVFDLVARIHRGLDFYRSLLWVSSMGFTLELTCRTHLRLTCRTHLTLELT